MNWYFESDRPIYAQLVEQIKLKIITDIYPPGSKLPSVRELASEAGVNPNTMQKALSELERDEFVFTQRTAGRFITEDQIMLQQFKKNLAANEIQTFFSRMKHLGFSQTEIQLAVSAALKEES